MGQILTDFLRNFFLIEFLKTSSTIFFANVGLNSGLNTYRCSAEFFCRISAEITHKNFCKYRLKKWAKYLPIFFTFLFHRISEEIILKDFWKCMLKKWANYLMQKSSSFFSENIGLKSEQNTKSFSSELTSVERILKIFCIL